MKRFPIGFFVVIWLAAALMLGTTAASAAMIGDADISYHAERTVVFKGHSYTGPVWAIPGKQRHEQDINGITLVVILQADTGTVTAILPSFKIYAMFPMSNDLDLSVLGPPVGTERVEGRRAAKYRLHHDEPDGTGAAGWLWVGPHHILVKLEGHYRTASGNSVPVSAKLSEIEPGPQDPALFEVPPDMTALPIEAITPFLGFK